MIIIKHKFKKMYLLKKYFYRVQNKFPIKGVKIMNIIYTPNCLTQFIKFPHYEIFFKGEDDQNEITASLNKATNADIKEKFEKIIKSCISMKNEEIAKEKVFIRINKKDIEKIVKNEEEYSSDEEYSTAYNPLEYAPNLYTELAKINDFSSLRKFINNFGLPMGKDFYNTTPYAVFIHEMDLVTFFEQLSTFKKALEVYEAIRLNDETKIREYSNEFKQFASNEYGYLLRDTFQKVIDNNGLVREAISKVSSAYGDELMKEITNITDRVWKELNKLYLPTNAGIKWSPNKTPEDNTLQYLSELLNKWEKGNSTNAVIDGKIQPATTFGTLLEVAFYQLNRAVYGNIEMARCEHCGALFEVTHGSRKFCPPLPKHDISSCQNAYNTKIKRKRKKARELAATGLSIEEISKKMKIAPNEVQSYLKSNVVVIANKTK